MSRLRLSLILLILAVPGCRDEADYPSRPITLVCPWSVGGGTDRVSRQMALYLEHELGVPVNVVNATGGQGVTGHSRGLTAAPDGYTITMMTVELNMLHWQGLTSITWQDAEPLMSINEDAAAVFVRSDSGFSNMREVLAAARENPGELEASGTAKGGIWHLALAGWLQSQELPPDAITWVPMNGAGPSLQELASGGLDLVCCSLPEGDQLYQAGEVRPLGVMDEQRVPGYPDVPTFKEQSMDWTMVGWRGLGVPKGTPQKRTDLLVRTIKRIVTGEAEVDGKTFPEFMEKQGFNNRWRPPEEFRAFLKENDKKFGKLLQGEAFSKTASSGIGPMTFPYILFAAMGVLLVSLGIGRVTKGKAPESVGLENISAAGLVNAGLVLAAVAAYLVFVERLGFVLTVGVLLVMLMWKFGVRLWVGAVIAVLLVPGLYHLFSHLLRVPLPQGLLGW